MKAVTVAASSLALLLATQAWAGPGSPPTTQPAAERARQNNLPQSSDPLWSVFAKTEVTADPAKGIFIAHHSDAAKALDGREVTLHGYLLQTDVLPPYFHFIVSRRTPVCAFCPPGEPNEAVEVFLKKFTDLKGGEVTVRGQLRLQKDGSQSLIFVLSNAEIIGSSA